LLLLPGVGQAKASALCDHLVKAADPLASIEAAETMKLVPAKSRGFFAGFVADLKKVKAVGPETDPSAAIGAILQGGYPATVRAKYERPENRLADLEQLAVLAARYQSLERMIAELLLAGDVYGMDSLDAEDANDALVLSTVHQAKGLEWSRVFILRLIEDGFPHYRALSEPGGEDEERRIFYVAVTRAMDELYLTYPQTVARGGRGPIVLTTPSRFVTEVDPGLYETAEVERGLDPGPKGPTRR
jgi:DNA helicase-2/ATP-dependent DNA helicase PcrA